jgi:hypothetical protein
MLTTSAFKHVLGLASLNLRGERKVPLERPLACSCWIRSSAIRLPMVVHVMAPPAGLGLQMQLLSSLLYKFDPS